MKRPTLTKLYLWSIVMMLFITLSACHSSKKTLSSSTESQWHTLEVPVKIEISKPMQFSMSGKAWLVADTSIYVSMRMLGMEVAYVVANADTVTLCDKYHKMYCEESLRAIVPAPYNNISTLQHIMLGCNVPAGLQQYVEVSDAVETPLGTAYSNIVVNATVEDKPVEIQLNYQFDKATWDGSKRTLPSLPKNAKRIDASTLLKSLQ